MRSPRAFTLIELLVVVAIITVLIAILLPSMSKALEVTNRAVCASNQHQISAALIQYATDYNFAVLCGSTIDYHYNMAMKDGGGNKSWGYLWDGDYVATPEAWLCPTMTATEASFNLPPDNDPALISWTAYGGRIGPDFIWNANLTHLPRLTQLPGRATIVTDWSARTGHVDSRHIEGVNAGHIDGAVAWVPRTGLYYELLDEQIGNASHLEYGWTNPLILRIWLEVFDRG